MKQWIACCVAAVAAVASGGLRTNDYSWVRGTHYYPTNDAAVIARELGYGKRVGLNTIRFRMQMEDWRKDPNGYTEKIRTFVRRVWASGYWSMPSSSTETIPSLRCSRRRPGRNAPPTRPIS